MSQSRGSSLKEALINIVIGYVIAVSAQVLIFPMFGIKIPLHENMAIGACFTVVSLIRQYIIRRWFNARKQPS